MTGRLFYEDDRDALRTAVAASGKTVQECAHHLWPNKKPETAYAKLKTCLANDGDEELKFSEALELMKFCNQFDGIYYACDDTLHTRPDRKAPEDHAVKIVGVMQDCAATMRNCMAQLEQLQKNGMGKA